MIPKFAASDDLKISQVEVIRKIAHQLSVTPSKHQQLGNIIVPVLNHFCKSLKHMKTRTNHTLNFSNHTENHGVMINN